MNIQGFSDHVSAGITNATVGDATNGYLAEFTLTVVPEASVYGSGVSFSYKLVVDRANKTFSLTPNTNSLYSFSDAITAQGLDASPRFKDTWITDPDLLEVNTLSAMRVTKLDFVKVWKDGFNRGSTRPGPDEVPSLFELMSNGSVVNEQPATAIDDLSNLYTDTYRLSFQGYPLYDSYSGPVPLSETRETRQYSVREKDIPGYVTTVEGTTFTNTLSTNFTFAKQWYDEADPSQRPDMDTWRETLKLQRRLRRGITWEDVTGADFSITEDETVTGKWKITLNDLPLVDDQNFEYEYRVVEAAASITPGAPYYEQSAENFGEYGAESTPGIVYQNGTLINTLNQTEGFVIRKQWKDQYVDALGGTMDDKNLNRPDVSFRLYRTVLIDGAADFDAFLPVDGHDTLELNSKADLYTFTYAADLPKYDPQGREFVYYAVETIDPTTPSDEIHDYKAIITNPIGSPAGAEGFILNGAEVINKPTAKNYLEYTKESRARSLQFMNMNIRVVLEKEISDDVWEQVVEDGNPVQADLDGIFWADLTKSSSFVRDKYDENGLPLTYRVRETHAGFNGQFYPINPDGTYTIAAPNAGDVNHVIDGTTLRVIYPQGQDGQPMTNYFINILEGTANLAIKKNWSPALLEGQASSVTVEVLRDNKPWNADGFDDPAQGIARVGATGSTFIITGTGSLDAVLRGLPKYDALGREHLYTIREIASTPTTHSEPSYIHYTYDAPTTTTTASWTNSQPGPGPGNTVRMDVEKNWVDDGDAFSRSLATMGWYYKDFMPLNNGTNNVDYTVPVAVTDQNRASAKVHVQDANGVWQPLTLTLSCETLWRGTYTYTYPSNAHANLRNAGNYIIREITTAGTLPNPLVLPDTDRNTCSLASSHKMRTTPPTPTTMSSLIPSAQVQPDRPPR